MDPQLTDSSSDSDISNSWSIVDQELCDTQASHGDKSVDNADNSVDKESISGSDGDSLEVIEDEEKRDADEFRDADVETDGISIITESEINEELDQALAWTEPKEKKYLHHPNTYLNSRLNVLLAISLAAVFGLGLGHFLGLQEECPLLNESATAQIEKLQQENQLLRNQLERLLHNERTFSTVVKTALDSTCSNDKYLVKKQISEDHAENQRYLKGSGLNLHSLDKPELEEESVVNKGIAIDLNCGSAAKMQVTTQDYLKSIEPEWVRTYPWPKAIDADEDVNPSASIDNVNLNKKGNSQHFQNEKESPVDTMHSENIFVTDFIKQNLKEENIREQISDDRKDQSLEAVRMAVALLESHFTVDDRTSPDAKDTLSSLQSLTSDLEQSLVHFQKAITNGEMDHSDFFAQMLKKMKESVNRVLNTMEEVADDVDEQMHKVLYKLTRKLKKLKGKLQEKWCHLSEKYNNKSHPILDWLQSTILVDCKKPKHNRFEEKVHVPKEGNNDNEFPTLPLNYKNEKEMPEFIKNTKLSYTHKMMYNQFGEVDAENNLLKPKLELDNGPPLILDSPLIISKTFLEPEQTMSNGFDKHDTYGSQRTYTATKKFNSEAPCWQAENGKMYCETLDNKAVNLGSESRKMSKTDEKASQKKIKSPKSTHRVEDKNKAKHEEQKSEFVKSKTVEQRGWVFPDINNNMQNNASGEWMMKLAKGRAEQRRLIHRSDWVFDRAHARRIQRDMDKKTQWYFQRAQGREYCRFHPKSAECQTGKLHNFQWDNSKADTKNRKHYTEDKSHYFSKWSKKFGKWMKNSFSDWHKVKYHSQH